MSAKNGGDKMSEENLYIQVSITSRLVDKSLLEEILYELNSLNGLWIDIEKEYIQLDFDVLIGKIKMVLK